MQCPECKKQVSVSEQQYGALFTCPECMAVYFVNFDGEPEYGEMSESEVSSADAKVNDQSYSFESLSNIENEINQDTDFNLPAEPFSDSISDPISEFNRVAQDISDYGNQEEIISQISYELKVSGLDSKDLVSQFKETIDDSKFGWIVQDIVDQIQDGQVVISKLNSIQAFVLAQRVYLLDLELEWTQHEAS